MPGNCMKARQNATLSRHSAFGFSTPPRGPVIRLSDRSRAPRARDASRLQMHSNGVVDGSAIPSSNGHDDRKADLPTLLENQSVPAREPVEGQTKAAEPVALMRIG